jgi:hypothetical protein
MNLAEPIIVQRFWCNRRGEAVVVQLREFEGQVLLDVRKYYTGRDGKNGCRSPSGACPISLPRSPRPSKKPRTRADQMNAVAPMVVAIGERRVDPLDCFIERADARAFLWCIGEYELQEAVDVLQHDAERDGLPRRIGADVVQTIIAAAFRTYREPEYV